MIKNGSLKNPSKVTVLYNEIDTPSGYNKDVLATEEGGEEDAKIIANALKEAGIDSDTFKLSEDSLPTLSKLKTDLVFNLADGIGSLPKTETKVPQLLDDLKIPYTGANAVAMSLTTNKALTKIVFRQNDLPTPNFAVFGVVPDALPPNLTYPLILKPVAEDCSLGITASSVVDDLQSLQKVVGELLRDYQEPVLCEEFIDGRELNVTVFGNNSDVKALPISEIIFVGSYQNSNKRKIVDFAAKWLEDSENYKDTKGVCPAELSKELKLLIENYAITAYKTCGGRDYARVDFRLRNGIPYLLEVNVNPDISPGMGASRSAKTHGWEYSEFMGQIARAAAARYSQSSL